MVPELAGTEPALRQRPAGRLEHSRAEHTAEVQGEGGGQVACVEQQVEHQLQQETIVVPATFNDQQQPAREQGGGLPFM